MAQSLAKIYVHLIFSTKNRERLIRGDECAHLPEYLGGILRSLNCPAIEIHIEPDHAHLLFMLARTETLSGVVMEIKRGSSVWLKEQSPEFHGFHWQNGFGAFSVSQSNVPEVRQYIRAQTEHHRIRTFQEEFRMFLKKYEVEYDERYVWD